MAPEKINLLSKEETDKIAEALNRKIPNVICPMCHTHEFSVADGYFSNVLQTDLINISISGTTLPTIVAICNNCGFVSQHALGVLGLLHNQQKKDGPNK